MTLKGIKIAIQPNTKQIESINANFGYNRFVYNQLLAMQNARYGAGASNISRFGMNYIIAGMKIEFPFLKDAESSSLQCTSTDLADAFHRFFTKQNGFPKFKSRKRSKNSYKINCINNNVAVVDNHYLKLPKLGLVKAYGLHRVKDKIKSAVVRKNPAGDYSVTLLVETEIKPFPETSKSIGLDLGLADLVIQSDGVKLKNKQFERSLAKKRLNWERKLARRRLQAKAKIVEAHKVGVELDMSSFKNVEKARQMVAKYNRKAMNQRDNYLHQYTASLVKNYDIIAMEDLKTKNLMKNKHLSRSIADSSWAKIKSMLAYKCEWYGKQLILVNPAYTSQECSSCHANTGKKPLRIREFTCPHCGVHHDRDVNAAINILNKALA